MRALIIGVAALAVVAATSARSAPIAYDESVSGDINLDTFVLDVGTNTISGSMRTSTSGSSFTELDADSFHFLTIPGGEIVSIATTITGVDFAGVSGGAFNLQLIEFNFTGLLETIVTFYSANDGTPILGTPTDVNFTVPASFASGSLGVTSGGSFGFNSFAELSYTHSLVVVSAVPEPATLTVLGLAIGGLALARRRGRKPRTEGSTAMSV